MAERVSITVEASGEHADVLTVQDALQQVLDAFRLMTGPDEPIVWSLVEASTNTPFTAVAEAVSFAEGVDTVAIARTQKRRFAEALVEIAEGRAPDDWMASPMLVTAKRFFERNVDGVGRTTVRFDDESVLVTQQTASFAINALSERPSLEWALSGEDRSRTEVGSIEGWLIAVGSHFNQPAIRLRDRKSRREIWCRVSQEQREKISHSASFNEVWENRRVRIRGRIRFDESGQVDLVYAESITLIKPRKIDISELRDPEFTDGLGAVEYLRRFREREFG